MFKPATTLHQHLFRTLVVVLLIYTLLAIITAFLFLMYPMLNRSADDLARIIADSTEQWLQASVTEQPELLARLKSRNELLLTEAAPNNNGRAYLPYVLILEQKLQQRLHQPITFYTSDTDPDSYWARVQLNTHSLYIGFSRSRIGTQPPLFFLSVMLFGIALSIVTSIYLAQRVTIEIRNLVNR